MTTILTARSRQAMTSGTTPTTSASGSPTITAASSTAVTTQARPHAGTYQRSRARLGGRRSSSRTSRSSGTAVPTWSGLPSSTGVVHVGCGASMTPAASSARATPSAPRARPRATKAASSTSSV